MGGSMGVMTIADNYDTGLGAFNVAEMINHVKPFVP